jgi:hypothetical protein
MRDHKNAASPVTEELPQATMSPEQEHIAIAIERYVVSATIPILYDADSVADQVGTGTLFTLAGRYFLVTAQHTFHNRDAGRFAIPKSRITGDLHSLGPHQLLSADSEEADIDIAILELLDEFTISYSKSEWKSLTLNDIVRPSSTGMFVLCGYPSLYAMRKEGLITGKPATAITNRIPIPTNADPPINPALDLFFRYGPGASDLSDKNVSVPPLRGVSGASVWEYREPENTTVWAPAGCLRAVGVETSFREGSYFRAKSWEMVLEMLRRWDSGLRDAINDKWEF